MTTDDDVVFAPDDKQLTVRRGDEVLHTNRFVAIMIGIPLGEMKAFYEAAGTMDEPFPEEWNRRIRRRYQEGAAHSGSENFFIAFDWWVRQDGSQIVVRDGNAYLEPVT